MKKLLLILFTLLLAGTLKAQDPTFTQAIFNPVYLNPAYAGSSPGIRIVLNNSRQYQSIIPITNNAATFSIDGDEPCVTPTKGSSFGWGITGFNSNQGEGFYSTSKIGGVIRFGSRIDQLKNFALAVGVNWLSYSIDWEKLEFSDQYDKVKGKVNPTAALSTNTGLPKNFPDFDCGIIYNQIFPKLARINLGISIHHVAPLNSSLLDDYSITPPRLTFLAAANWGHGQRDILKGGFQSAYFIYDQNLNYRTFNYQPFNQFTMGYIFETRPFWLGAAAHFPFRLNPSIGLMAGLQGKLKSYDRMYQISFSAETLKGVFETYEVSLMLYFDGSHIFSRCYDKESYCDRTKGEFDLAPIAPVGRGQWWNR